MKNNTFLRRPVFMLVIAILFSVIITDSASADSNDEPRLVMESYTVSEGEVINGEIFKLTFNLRNTNGSMEMNNIMMTFTSSGDVFIPPYGKTNVIYIERIGAGQVYTGSVELEVNNPTEGYYPLEFKFSYHAGARTDLTASARMNLHVKVWNEISISEIETATSCYVNYSIPISVYYENFGSKALKNIVMNMEGNIEDDQKVFMIGDLAAKQTSYIDYHITYIESGIQTLHIWFTYEDADGIKYKTERYSKTVSVDEVTVTEAPVQTGGGDTPRNNGVSYNLIFIAGGIVILVGAAVGLFIFFTRRRRY